jgi:hypothetical protein
MGQFYIIAASMSETLYRLFDCFFGFLSWRQVERYRSKRIPVLGLQNDAFCLSKENFHALAQKYMSRGSDTRVCLCVDVLSHMAHVLVDPHTGEVTGLTDPLILDRETANFLKNNPDAFAQFVRDHSYMVVKLSLAFYLTRLDPREKAFPMVILPSVQGQATDATILSFSFVCQILVEKGVDLRGIAFDGDVKYLHYLNSFKTRIDDLQKINLRSPFSGIVPHEGPGLLKTHFIY